ncbi:hypothetical protein AeRB84_016891 [Aphanomyces euteiches]|nr:hypothetical protein AeRB84_016891 [Aphanomyces euteiches]
MTDDFVEFHPSMSLVHQPRAPSVAPATSKIPRLSSKRHRQSKSAQSILQPEEETKTTTSLSVDQIHGEREALWLQVDKILEMASHLDKSQALEHLKQLKKLHAICRAREMHVQTIKLGLMHERNEYLDKLVTIDKCEPRQRRSFLGIYCQTGVTFE